MGHWRPAPQITHTDTSSAHTNIAAATQICHTDTSSAHTNITAAPHITLSDTSSANANITAATQITLADTSSADTNITAAPQITLSDTSSADTNITAATQITLSDTSSADTNITAATQITLADTSSADTNITAAPQITLSDTSSSDTNKTAATQITLSDTSSADTNITAATQITLSDTSSADTNITAATQITLSDTSSADTNITAAPQITLTDTSSANTNITAATQITLTDTSSANANITTATQITPTDTSSANTNPTAATNSQFDTLSGPLRTRSPLWRALRRSRRRLRTVANGCGRKRKTWRTQPHPQTPKWNGNPRYAFGKKNQTTSTALPVQVSEGMKSVKTLRAAKLSRRITLANLALLFGVIFLGHRWTRNKDLLQIFCNQFILNFWFIYVHLNSFMVMPLTYDNQFSDGFSSYKQWSCQFLQFLPMQIPAFWGGAPITVQCCFCTQKLHLLSSRLGQNDIWNHTQTMIFGKHRYGKSPFLSFLIVGKSSLKWVISHKPWFDCQNVNLSAKRHLAPMRLQKVTKAWSWNICRGTAILFHIKTYFLLTNIYSNIY